MMRFLFICSIVVALLACEQKQVGDAPRPKGYNRIELPSAKYIPLESGHPYQFEMSAYAKVIPDTVTIGNKKEVF